MKLFCYVFLTFKGDRSSCFSVSSNSVCKQACTPGPLPHVVQERSNAIQRYWVYAATKLLPFVQCEKPRTFSRPLLLRISSVHAIHDVRVPRHVFQARASSRNSTKYRTDDLCGNLICEYFCWMLGEPHFFFGRSLPFRILSIIVKNKKNLCVGTFGRERP